MRRRFQVWGKAHKSKRGSLYDSMEGAPRAPSKRDLKKEASTTNINDNIGASVDSGDLERIKNLTTEQAVLKILKVQKELTKVKKRIQDRRVVQQIELHNLQSRKTKLHNDLNLQMGGSPWTHAEYLAFLRDVFEDSDDPFPSDKKFADEAVKTLRQEHKCHLYQKIAKMVSEQNNADLMLVMGSEPELKEEMNKRADRIRKVIAQVTKENDELKNVLHYKQYILDKMKNRMEIKITRRTSLSAAMVGLKNLELKTLQELADADSVDGSEASVPGIPPPSKWNSYRSNLESHGLASISDDEPLEEEDEEEDEDSSDPSKGNPLGDSVDGSLDHDFQQSSEDEYLEVEGNDQKSLKSRQRLKAQLARKQLEEKRNRRNHSSSSSASFSSETSGSASGGSNNEIVDSKDERTRRAEAARKRLEAKRRQNKLQQGTSSASEATPTSDGTDQQSDQQSSQNEEGQKPLVAEQPMMSAAQKARLARQRRAEQMKANNGDKGFESGSDGPSQLNSSIHQEANDLSQRSRSVPMPPPENVLKSPLWSVAKRAKDRERESKIAIPALPDMPDSPPEDRESSPAKKRAPGSKRMAERQKRIEQRLDRTSQHRRRSTDSELDDEPQSKPLSFSQLAKSHKTDNFPTNTLSSMNSDTQARIRQSLNQANPVTKANGDGFSELVNSHHNDSSFPQNTLSSMNSDTQARIRQSLNQANPVTQSNGDGFSELANSHHNDSSFPQNTLSTMNSDTQARILNSMATGSVPGQTRSGSLPSEKPLLSSAEQRALQAIADSQRRSSLTNAPSQKRISTAEQRALQAIADAQKGANSLSSPAEKRVSSAEQRALQAIAEAQKGGNGLNSLAEKRISSAEQRALQAIAEAQKGGNSPNPLSEKRISSAEQRALQAIAEAQKGDNESNESELPSGYRAENSRELSASQRKTRTTDANRTSSTGLPVRITPPMRDSLTRKQSTRMIESDRVKEQRQRAQLARQRLEEQRKLRQNRGKTGTGDAETDGKDESSADNTNSTRSARSPMTREGSRRANRTSISDNTNSARGSRSTMPPREGSRRQNRTVGSSRQTAIERSRARRARGVERTKSNDL